MKRKTFISIVAVLLTGFTASLFVFRRKLGQFYQPLKYPVLLTLLFDKKTIIELGISYRLKHNSENDINRLKQLLLVDSSGKIYNEEEKIELGEMLKKETNNDFETGKTTVVNGWVLSITEVRQCALCSLSGF